MSQEAAAVVQQYFECIRAREPKVVELFHEDAELVGLGGVRSGKAAIRQFYEATIAGSSPSPSLVGELLSSGARVAAEIQISLADGSRIHAVDVFVIDAGLIRSLTYFIADH